jgi:hypothetical protein
LGLTEMGQIKQQLSAEAAAEDAAAAAAPVMLDPGTLARLDRIEAHLAAIGAIIGAPAAPLAVPPAAPAVVAPQAEAVAPAPEPAPAPAPEPAPEPVPELAAPEPAAPAVVETAPAETAPPIEEAVAAATAGWRDEVSYTLAPGEGIEVKLVMQEGAVARFEWTANGAVVNYDTHGDGGGQKISYEQGRGVPEQAGELTAAFTGNHGWFWRNRTDAPVTVTLRTGGDYAELRAP